MLGVIDKAGWLNLVYLLAAVLFIFGLKMLGQVKTAKRGNLVSALGMLVATAATFFFISGGQWTSLIWIGIAIVIGSAIGLWLALTVPMTGMPQMVALLNGFGGIASLLVACGDYVLPMPTAGTEEARLMLEVGRVLAGPDGALHPVWFALLATGLAALIGGVTFTGSIVAWAKLQGVSWMPDQPVQFPLQKLVIAALLLGCLALSVLMPLQPDAFWINGVFLLVITIAALVLGVLLVIGIGGADMPVVISLLNSYSGLAAAMAGFVLGNFVLIIVGSLVGASGLILTRIMCVAMNRSLLNVLFGGVGGGSAQGGGPEGTHRTMMVDDVVIAMESADQVMIVPGYGMAVAQAQHAVKELQAELEKRGVTVRYAIHPVAGRMPGHMNVLLAEAGVPYENLYDLDQANAEFEQSDVALVIGANDVTNPAARHDKGSPIYGMPILDVDKARQVFVIKRSMNPGFAGIQNELYFTENCGMVFGDAKKVVTELTQALKDA